MAYLCHAQQADLLMRFSSALIVLALAKPHPRLASSPRSASSIQHRTNYIVPIDLICCSYAIIMMIAALNQCQQLRNDGKLGKDRIRTWILRLMSLGTHVQVAC